MANKKRLRLAKFRKAPLAKRWMLKTVGGVLHHIAYDTYEHAERDACEKALCDCRPVPVEIFES